MIWKDIPSIVYLGNALQCAASRVCGVCVG